MRATASSVSTLDVTEPVVSSMPGTTAVATARAAAEASTRIRNRMPHLGTAARPGFPHIPGRADGQACGARPGVQTAKACGARPGAPAAKGPRGPVSGAPAVPVAELFPAEVTPTWAHLPRLLGTSADLRSSVSLVLTDSGALMTSCALTARPTRDRVEPGGGAGSTRDLDHGCMGRVGRRGRRSTVRVRWPVRTTAH